MMCLDNMLYDSEGSNYSIFGSEHKSGNFRHLEIGFKPCTPVFAKDATIDSKCVIDDNSQASYNKKLD